MGDSHGMIFNSGGRGNKNVSLKNKDLWFVSQLTCQIYHGGKGKARCAMESNDVSVYIHIYVYSFVCACVSSRQLESLGKTHTHTHTRNAIIARHFYLLQGTNQGKPREWTTVWEIHARRDQNNIGHLSKKLRKTGAENDERKPDFVARSNILFLSFFLLLCFTQTRDEITGGGGAGERKQRQKENRLLVKWKESTNQVEENRRVHARESSPSNGGGGELTLSLSLPLSISLSVCVVLLRLRLLRQERVGRAFIRGPRETEIERKMQTNVDVMTKGGVIIKGESLWKFWV